MLKLVKDLALTPDTLLHAYRVGLFPMAQGRESDHIDWFCPDPRAILPLDHRFKIRRSLAKRRRNAGYRFTFDQAFSRVLENCAQPRPDSSGTWISDGIMRVYNQLHHAGHAHSVEAWQGPQLVGGLYGVSVGAAFCGESMFSRASGASQLCLIELVQHLRRRRYTLLDTQFVNPHLEQFGVLAVPRAQYLEQLAHAIDQPVTWQGQPPTADADETPADRFHHHPASAS